MLALPLVQEIDRLLQEGKLSQRKIAARLGVSRGTVGAIASGRRGLYGKDPDADRASNANSLAPQLPPERCQRCGAFVYMPCLICRARDHRARQTRLRKASQATTPARCSGDRRAQSLRSSTHPRRARVA